MKMSDNFERFLKTKCSNHEMHEGRNLFPGISERLKTKRNRNNLRNLISGIAASILLVVSLYFGINTKNIEPNNTAVLIENGHEQTNLTSAIQQEPIEVNITPSINEIDKVVSSSETEIETVLLSEYRGQVIILPDSSMVTLEKGASLSYNSQYGVEGRKVNFSGTGYFEVQSDKSKPFIIETPNSLTKVVGTSFNLISIAKIPDCIAVTSGIVEFSNKESTISKRLKKGQIAELNHEDIRVSWYSNNNFLSWKTGSLIFENSTLKDVIIAMNQYFGKEFRLENSALESCTFSGKFESPDLDNLLEVMSLSLGIEYRIDGNRIIFSGIGCNKD